MWWRDTLALVGFGCHVVFFLFYQILEVFMNGLEAWQSTLGELKLQMTQATFNTWLKDARLINEKSGKFTIGVRNAYAKDWLENRLVDTVIRTLEAIVDTPVEIEFVVQVEEELRPSLPHNSTNTLHRSNGSISLNIVHFDPREKLGWLKCGHYQNFFWRMFLNARAKTMGAVGASPFDLWMILQSWPFIKKTDSIDIQELADVYAGGNRHRILGRMKRGKRQIGDLEILEAEKLAWHTTVHGKGTRQVRYVINVLGDLPLLTPTQASLLTPDVLKLHDAVVATNRLNLSEWRQLDMETLVCEEVQENDS